MKRSIVSIFLIVVSFSALCTFQSQAQNNATAICPPPSSQLAFVQSISDSISDVVVLNTQGELVVADTYSPELSISGMPSWEGDGDVIFQETGRSFSRIFQFSPQTERTEKLFESELDVYMPTTFLDGTTMFLAEIESLRPRLYRLNGADIEKVFTFNNTRMYSFSKNGKLAYISADSSESTIDILEIGGQTTKLNLIDQPDRVSISNDAEWIAYTTEYSSFVYFYKLDAPQVVQLDTEKGALSLHGWTYDGKILVSVFDEQNVASTLYLLDPEGLQVTPLFRIFNWIREVEISIDGQIALVTNTLGSSYRKSNLAIYEPCANTYEMKCIIGQGYNISWENRQNDLYRPEYNWSTIST